jgi:hypothetical protein
MNARLLSCPRSKRFGQIFNNSHSVRHREKYTSPIRAESMSTRIASNSSWTVEADL